MIKRTYLSLVVAVAFGSAAVGCSTAAQPIGQMTPSDVVATVGPTQVTLGEVDAIALQDLVSSYGSVKLLQALYLARRAALDQLVARRLIEQEAKARGVEADSIVRQEIDGKAKAVTDADIDFWYQTNPTAVQGRSLDQLREPIRSLLTERRMAEAHDRFVDSLKVKTTVTDRLEPPRQQVAATGFPTRGPASAPVTIVEFSDFQCPFCQRANPTVEQVIKTYGDRVRFVYRHLPLPNHANARPAAEAAACADAQGQFWKYHDRLFGAPDRLSAADLKSHAVVVGLDETRFNACVDSRATKDVVERDMKDADAAGVTSTPSFFINGRPLEGAQPFEAFKRMIDEELAAKK